MFKVLVISYYFPPMGLSGVQRVFKFVKYMKNFNWDPTIITTGITGNYTHDLSLLKECENLNLRIIRTENSNSYSVLSRYEKIKMPPQYFRKFLIRFSRSIFIPDSKIFWADKAFKIAKDMLHKENFDIIFVSGPPFSSMVIAAKLSRLFDVSLFVDYRDLWSKNPFAFNLTPLHGYLHRRMEYYTLKVADKIIVVNRKIKEKLINSFNFLTFEDVSIIPHGFDNEDFDSVQPEPKLNNKMKLLYAGTFFEHITPKYFLQAFREVVKERPDIAENIELHFAGRLRKENIKLIKKLKLIPYVKDHGYLEHSELIKKLISCDVLWFMIADEKGSENITPGKLFEYFGSGKPILGCVPEGAAKSALQEYGASFISEPEDIGQIKKAIINAHSLYREGKLPIPNDEFVQKHRRDYQTEQLTKLFQFFLKEV